MIEAVPAPSPLSIALGRRLRALRGRRTIDEWVELTGDSRAGISERERGLRMKLLDTLHERLSRAGVDPMALLESAADQRPAVREIVSLLPYASEVTLSAFLLILRQEAAQVRAARAHLELTGRG